MSVEEFSDEVKFNSSKDIPEEERWEICSQLCCLYNQAIESKDPLAWEEFGMNAMYAKLLLPEEQLPLLNGHSYKGIDKVVNMHYEKNRLTRHLKLAAAEKILFPEMWGLRKQYFHSDEIVWKKLKENLEGINPGEQWKNLSHFFDFAKNMKIVAPTRFESIDLQKILGKNVWIHEIEKELELLKYESYRNFASLAISLHILEFPSKIILEPYECKEMNIEAERLKNDDILTYTEFSGKRNILSSQNIKITEKSFDLLF